MATFPTLKTSAVAQYPATRVMRFQNQILRFLDGREQRYRDSAGPLHRWEVRLTQLDESEMALMLAFLEVNQGTFASFTFVDPWDGKSYANCSLESDVLDLITTAEMNGKTRIVIKENR